MSPAVRSWPRLGWPRLALLLLGAAGLVPGFVSLAPNRLVSGQAISIWQATPLSVQVAGALLGLVGLGTAFVQRQAANLVALAAMSALAALLIWGAGLAAASLAAAHPGPTRIGLGAGFWTLLFADGLLCLDALQSLRAGPGLRLAVAAGLAGGFGGLAWSGQLSALSLAREYASHQAVFQQALLRHGLLACAAVLGAVALGVPLGLAMLARRRLRSPVFAALGVVQTVPSVALFGLLLTPLAAAGLSGIGVVPAAIALVLYGLLPVVRSTVAGVEGVDASVLEAARGMGLSPGQVALRVTAPLAAPALLAGLRIVTVQSIGLAVVAALIGAGGLGDFVFQGLGQYASDLVLLGALPAILMALAANFAIGLASSLAEATVR